MAELNLLEACTLFVDDEVDPHHFSLMNLDIPEITMETFEHKPGGGAMAINMGMNLLAALELKWKIVGLDDVFVGKFGPRDGRTRITARGAIRDKFTNKLTSSIITTTGMIGAMRADSFKRGDEFGIEFEMKEVFKFDWQVNGSKLLSLDYESNDFFVGGSNRFAEVNAILGII